jgi:hypothetical protein
MPSSFDYHWDGNVIINSAPQFRDCSSVSLFHACLFTKPLGVSLFRKHGHIMENRNKPAGLISQTLLLLLLSGDIQLNPLVNLKKASALNVTCWWTGQMRESNVNIVAVGTIGNVLT